MNFQGKAVLIYLEEDNIARAYFRVHPLMTQDGPVGDMSAAFPDDGFLRIVPDKNEQHSFKERMRSLCGLCIMDLRYQPAEANKIRTNKNYAPIRGETNQYIIYSDAIRPLPQNLLYQVVSGDALMSAVTPLVYIRSGANIQGPYYQENGQPAGEIVPLAPDSAEIHALTVNHQDLLFYWPKEAVRTPEPVPPQPFRAAVPEDAPAFCQPAPAFPQPAPAEAAEKPAPLSAYEQIQALNVPAAALTNRLQDSPARPPVDYVPEQPQRPLTGTRLYQPPLRTPVPRRAHNPLMETVERERYAARYEAPGATIAQTADLREVHNPADALKRALQDMWRTPESQSQAVDVLLNQPGMRPVLAKAVSKEANDLTASAMQSQLQELEAERLMTLMQLDDAKKNLAAAREAALGKLNQEEQSKLDALKAQQAEAEAALNSLKASLSPIIQERDAAIEALKKAKEGLSDTCLIAAREGEDADKAALIDRLEKSLRAAGFLVEKGDAQAMLTAFALTDGEWECRCAAEADGEMAIRAFAAALGVRYERIGCAGHAAMLPGGSAPVLTDCRIASPLATASYACRKEQETVVPSVPLAVDMDALPGVLPAYPPVSKACILREMLNDSPLEEETKAVLQALRKAAAAAEKPLPLQAVAQMARFIASTEKDFTGGVAEAIDRAVCLFAVPFLTGGEAELDGVRSLLAAMPRALKRLNA